MIYGFDDNKNRVEVPDANFKIVNYAYDLSSNSSDNPLTLNVGEAVITTVYSFSGQHPFTHVSNEHYGNYVIIKLPSTSSGFETITEASIDGDLSKNTTIGYYTLLVELYPYTITCTENSNEVTYRYITNTSFFILRVS